MTPDVKITNADKWLWPAARLTGAGAVWRLLAPADSPGGGQARGHQ